jgi:MFS family permease
VRNFRLFLFGHLVSSTGTWMQQVGQDWLVLRLTNAALPLGITLALQFSPMLAFGAWAGLVADRVDKRRLLLATQTAMAVLALALGALTATGAVQLWMVYTLALLLGVCTAFDMPARQSFVSEMVGPDRVVNAVGLNSASFNTARVVGPALAGGLIAAVGIAPAFFLNAVSFLAMIGGLLAMDPDRLHRRAAVERGRGQIRAGVRYVWATPALRSTILLVAVVGMLGLNYRVALPLLARFAFSGGPGVYGALAAVMAAGSVAGALAVACRGRPTAVHAGRGAAPVPDRRGQPGLRGHGQLDHAARLRAGDARPGDEPVRPGPARLDPAERPAQRVDGRPVRPPVDPAAVRGLLRGRGRGGRPGRPRPGRGTRQRRRRRRAGRLASAGPGQGRPAGRGQQGNEERGHGHAAHGTWSGVRVGEAAWMAADLDGRHDPGRGSRTVPARPGPGRRVPGGTGVV